jgi:hypothetical protein
MVARDGVEPFRVLCYQQVADSTIRAIRTLRSDCKSCVHFVCSRYRSNLPSHTRCAWLSLQISGSPLFCTGYRDFKFDKIDPVSVSSSLGYEGNSARHAIPNRAPRYNKTLETHLFSSPPFCLVLLPVHGQADSERPPMIYRHAVSVQGWDAAPGLPEEGGGHRFSTCRLLPLDQRDPNSLS